MTDLVPQIGGGLGVSLFGMSTNMEQLHAASDNIANYGVAGYQAVKTFQTSLSQLVGPFGLQTRVSEEHGRIRRSGYPLDVALNTPGYLHRATSTGEIEPTRDGRMRLDKDGFLVSLDNKRFLTASGQPVQLPYFPEDMDKQVKINPDGELILYDGKTGERDFMARLGVFDKNGSLYLQPDIKQAYVEDSNVNLQQEFTKMLPLRRGFEANRQMFIIQSDGLTKMIQALGQP